MRDPSFTSMLSPPPCSTVCVRPTLRRSFAVAILRGCIIAVAAVNPACAQALAPIDPSDSSLADATAMQALTSPGGYVYAVAYDQQLAADASIAIAHYGATFAENSPHGDVFDCPAQTMHGCTLFRCPIPSNTEPLQRVSAGVVHVAGPAHTFDLSPSAMNDYGESLDPAERQWPPGARFEVSATGSDAGIPAFEGSVELPQRVDLISPVGIDSTAPLRVDRAADLSFHWTPEGTGSFRVRAYASRTGSGPLVVLECSADVATTTLTVPADGLETVFTETQSNIAVLEVWRTTRAVVLDGPWHVELLGQREIAFGSLEYRH